MPSLILKNFQTRRKKTETSLKAEKGFEAMLKLVKDSAKLETALGAFDKALDAKDAEKARTAQADFLRLSGLYRGKIVAELTKIKKKAGGAEDTDAYADTVLLHTELLSEEQDAPRKVKALPSQKQTNSTLEVTALYSLWVGLKKLFEAETGKKKPSETFLKKFRMSSGLETALKAVDLATKKNDAAGLKKAVALLDTKAADYAKLVHVQKGVAVATDDEGGHDDEQNPDYQQSLTKLLQGLNLCRNKAQSVLDSAD